VSYFNIFARSMNSPHATDDPWICRCFDLAARGTGFVSPNPPVGAVLVYKEHIIGEGFHTAFGQAHAEVEALESVPERDRHLIPESVLYVSLEPCCITAKTPPCTDLIIKSGIRDVRISTLDPNPAIAGKGVAMLKANGISTTVGILDVEGRYLIRSFTTNILQKRPHVVLKWAQSKFNYVGAIDKRVLLSKPGALPFTHRLRHEADAILVGARTVEIDDPALTVREFPGRSPHRAVYDPHGKLNAEYHIFKDDGRTVFYFSMQHNPQLNGAHIIQQALHSSEQHCQQMLTHLFNSHIGNVLIEGGAYTQKQFINECMWDEAWVIQTAHALSEGIKAPNVRGRLIGKEELGSDRIIGIAPDPAQH
jgi:diaminohydroxyphosphoribosylaminopyrimidine deaminase/5-amino-6-(5-phosphoribosylamino)uracil reductase